jgi:ABC-2 type transport system ATP-binding protein
MIEVKSLTKLFGNHLAVDKISFTAKKGEILGFLGPNGAGKSTTMRMITGFFPPTGGTVVIGGSDIQAQSIAARKKMGYLPENAPVYPDMTVSSYLDFCAEIRGFSGSKKNSRVTETLERCFLTTVKSQPVNTLSKGYKQRVCFAQSILHDPEYLILDEPTDGLDPNQKPGATDDSGDERHKSDYILHPHFRRGRCRMQQGHDYLRRKSCSRRHTRWIASQVRIPRICCHKGSRKCSL